MLGPLAAAFDGSRRRLLADDRRRKPFGLFLQVRLDPVETLSVLGERAFELRDSPLQLVAALRIGTADRGRLNVAEELALLTAEPI